jgi:uncharacterized SAM-binding protein YcdF (DUF218 family)
MFIFLSKFLPLFVYPAGLACLLLILALVLRRKTRWRNALTAFALAALWIGGNRWVATLLTRSLEWRYLPPATVPHAEVIVVLGGGTEAAQWPRPDVEVNSAGDRVIYAARLYAAGAAPHLLLSGGYITWLGDRPSTPAQEMADLLELMGVPSQAMWLQEKSQNTYEDAVFSAEMLARKDIHRIILVTSAIHMPRSLAVFRHQGLEVIPAPADFSVTQADWDNLVHGNLAAQVISLLPNASSLEATSTAMKEYIGLAVYGLRGWTSPPAP